MHSYFNIPRRHIFIYTSGFFSARGQGYHGRVIRPEGGVATRQGEPIESGSGSGLGSGSGSGSKQGSGINLSSPWSSAPGF